MRYFLASGLAEKVVCLRPTGAGDAAALAQRIRVVTPNGRIHVLMTSLFDAAAYPATEFAALYHGRWRIEDAFKRLKHRLGLEHTSGLSGHAARQDFGAKAVGDHLNARAAYAATDACLESDSDTKINQKINGSK